MMVHIENQVIASGEGSRWQCCAPPHTHCLRQLLDSPGRSLVWESHDATRSKPSFHSEGSSKPFRQRRHQSQA